MEGSEESVDIKGQQVDCPRKKIKLDEAENMQSVMDNHQIAENDPMIGKVSEEKVDMTVLNGENPEQILLCIPDIREKILDFLSHSDMKKFRLTNSTWNNILSTYILKKVTQPIRFKFNSKLKEYRSPTKFGPRSLSNFLDCFAKSKIFPCSNFTFVGGEIFSDVEADWVISFRQFFSTIGPQIQTLCIKEDSSTPMVMNMDTLRSILLVNAPHIETLKLSYFPSLVWNDSNRLSLPALKSLTCLSKRRESTTFDMLENAPNLRSVYFFKVKYIDSFLSKFKIDLIKSLNLKPTYYRQFVDVEKLVTLATALPKLTAFGIVSEYGISQQHGGDYVRAVNSILESSKESLHFFATNPISMAGLIFPQLTNVKQVRFVPLYETSPFFPAGMRLSDIFPSVKDVVWYFPATTINCQSLIPPGIDLGSLTNVHGLTVNTRQFDDCLKMLGGLTPNVTSLTIIGMEGQFKGKQLLQSIFTRYPNITKLYIQDCKGQLLPSFSDSSLTGIPVEICELLRQANGQLVKELCDVKTRPGISDFKGLKQFKIVLDNNKWTNVNLSRPFLPSWVSGVYGFSRLPDLKVTIAFTQYCTSSQMVQLLLTPLIQYVTLVHELVE